MDWRPTPIAYPVTRTAGTDPGPPAEQLGGHLIALGADGTALVVNTDGTAQELPLAQLRFRGDGLTGAATTSHPAEAEPIGQPWPVRMGGGEGG
jgi:hypothetical protein